MSKVIKPHGYIALDDMKRINVIHYQPPSPQETNKLTLEELEKAALDDQLEQMRRQIINDAEFYAEEQVRLAAMEADQLRQSAQEEAEQWWASRRAEDAAYMEEIREQAFQQGYQEGASQAEAAVHQHYEAAITQASDILEDAQLQKERLIQEAEPFLLELSCAIARKIIQHELAMSPDAVLQLIRKALTRRKERGLITLCVSPEHYAFVQDAKEELLVSLDSQAELQILPDSSVQDFGCVVRSSFGSIDARIDTQLSEIKSALMQLSNRDGDDAS